MFVVVPEVAEANTPEAEEPLPELAIVDYPRSLSRLYWLYVYYLSWSESPMPFLDRRSPLAVTRRNRRAFVYFTNMYYANWMRSRMQAGMPSFDEDAGRMALCLTCRKKTECKELCMLALSKRQVFADVRLTRIIQVFLTQVRGRARASATTFNVIRRNYSPSINILFAESIDIRPALEIDYDPPPLVPISEGQEEDDEWE